MAAGATIKHKRKSGSFSAGELAAGEMGIDTTNKSVYFSPNGSEVRSVSGSGIGLPYVRITNNATPGPGEFSVSSDDIINITTVKIHYTDKNGADNGIELVNANFGDKLVLSSVNGLTATVRIFSRSWAGDVVTFSFCNVTGSLVSANSGIVTGVIVAEAGQNGRSPGVVLIKSEADWSATDPGATYYKTNQGFGAPSSITALYVSNTDTSATNLDSWFSLMGAGDLLTATEAFGTEGDGFSIWQVTADPTNNTGWWTIPVALVAGDHLPSVGGYSNGYTALHLSKLGPVGGAASGYKLLATYTASGLPDIKCDNIFDDSLYAEYLIVGSMLPATDGVGLDPFLRTAVPEDVAGGYDLGYVYGRLDAAGSATGGNDSANFSITAVLGNGANEGIHFRMTLHLNSGSYHWFEMDQIVTNNAGARYWAKSGGQFLDTTLRQGIRFVFSSGNVASGTVRVYGLLKNPIVGDGARLIPRGTWATSVNYSVLDLVLEGGASYVCTTTHLSGSTTRPNSGASWTSNWQLVAEKGEASGFKFLRDPNNAVPAAGEFSVNSDTVSSITTLLIHETDAVSNALSGWFDSMAADDIIFLNSGASGGGCQFRFVSQTDSGSYRTITVAGGVGTLQAVGKYSGFLLSKRGAAGVGIGSNYALYEERQTPNTNGGTFTSGADRTRTLNTEVVDTNNIGTLASSQITLGAGTYYCAFWSTGTYCDAHRAKIRNVTAGTDLLIGATARLRSSGGSDVATAYGNSISQGQGQFTLSVTSVIELQARCQTTRAGDGFGAASNLFSHETYAAVELWKIA